ncbi:MAG: DNA topology modulation protein FlaR [Rhodobacteraceae bacterium]|nr:DNA topology modulation protein FlaR [Paracoccaceae bacterium]
MKRVMIVGGAGSGKSTLARRLGKRTGLPVYHMDHVHWKPNWVERSKAEKRDLCERVHALDQWIFEGNASDSYAERAERADTLIWLDLPVHIRMWRVINRCWKYHGKNRADLPKGCTERFNLSFLKFLKFVWATRHSTREKVLKIYQNPPHRMDVYRFTSQETLNRFMQRFQE